jgi:hypothetical protein
MFATLKKMIAGLKSAPARTPAARRTTLGLEVLEAREVPATYSVAQDTLYDTTGGTGHWVQLSATGTILSDAVGPDGTLYALGTDHTLYNVTAGWAAVAQFAPGSVNMLNVANNGTVSVTLVGDQFVYVLQGGAWVKVTGAGQYNFYHR